MSRLGFGIFISPTLESFRAMTLTVEFQELLTNLTKITYSRTDHVRFHEIARAAAA